MANDDLDVYIIANNVSSDLLKRQAGHRPILSFTDAGRRPSELHVCPCKETMLKIARYPGDFQLSKSLKLYGGSFFLLP